MDVFRNRLIDVLHSAKNESPAALAETKGLVNSFFMELSHDGGFPDVVGPANISAQLEEEVQDFLNYLKNNENDMLDDLENYSSAVLEVSAMVAGRRRKSKTRKHFKRRKHTRKHYRPKGKKL